LGLINSVNPCLSPYQREFLLKNNSNRLIYNIPENQKYSAKKELGVGRLDAFESVSAAASFDCNNPNFKTMYIEGVDINHKCITSTGKPKLKVTVKNGNGNYDYRWTMLNDFGNTAAISSYTDAEPTITAALP